MFSALRGAAPACSIVALVVGCGSSDIAGDAVDEPVASAQAQAEGHGEVEHSTGSPGCPPITSEPSVVQEPTEADGRPPPVYQSDLQAHARDVVRVVMELYGAFTGEFARVPTPFVRSTLPPGPWPQQRFPCISVIEEVRFEQRDGSAYARVALKLPADDETIDVVVHAKREDDQWVAAELPDVDGALALTRIKRWLADATDVSGVAAESQWPFRRIRVRDKTGTTLCFVDAVRDGETLGSVCWREARPITGVWGLELDDDVDRVGARPEIFRVGLGLERGTAELWDVKPAAGVRRPVGSTRVSSNTPQYGPFWSDRAVPRLQLRNPSSMPAPGAWETIEPVKTPAPVSALGLVDIEPVPSLAGVHALAVLRRVERSERTMLCIKRLPSYRWACGELALNRQDWEIVRTVERIEPIDAETYVVQSSMRIEGGHGEGSGARGSAELYVVRVQGEQPGQVATLGWLPIGGMRWITTNVCPWAHEACYVREVHRAHYEWSAAAAGCLTVEPLRAQHAVTDDRFSEVDQNRGRRVPTSRVRGQDAHGIVASGFPGRASRGALLPLSADLNGSWRWTGSALSRGECSD